MIYVSMPMISTVIFMIIGTASPTNVSRCRTLPINSTYAVGQSLYNSRLMLDRLNRFLNDEVNHEAVIKSVYHPPGAEENHAVTVGDGILLMLWGVVQEQLIVHVSQLRDFPRGCFTNLVKTVKSLIRDCPKRWEPAFQWLLSDDNNGVPAINLSSPCVNMQAFGVTSIKHKSVSTA